MYISFLKNLPFLFIFLRIKIYKIRSVNLHLNNFTFLMWFFFFNKLILTYKYGGINKVYNGREGFRRGGHLCDLSAPGTFWLLTAISWVMPSDLSILTHKLERWKDHKLLVVG